LVFASKLLSAATAAPRAPAHARALKASSAVGYLSCCRVAPGWYLWFSCLASPLLRSSLQAVSRSPEESRCVAKVSHDPLHSLTIAVRRLSMHNPFPSLFSRHVLIKNTTYYCSPLFFNKQEFTMAVSLSDCGRVEVVFDFSTSSLMVNINCGTSICDVVILSTAVASLSVRIFRKACS